MLRLFSYRRSGVRDPREQVLDGIYSSVNRDVTYLEYVTLHRIFLETPIWFKSPIPS